MTAKLLLVCSLSHMKVLTVDFWLVKLSSAGLCPRAQNSALHTRMGLSAAVAHLVLPFEEWEVEELPQFHPSVPTSPLLLA